ncbi:MAG: hypothetical protein VR72_11080 [Clostridiaceae bacterium BRH_c20a]|nr:MAG: hypothetical protein VR72_11080 [Clostridiaceae bacterium BRH_c20a]
MQTFQKPSQECPQLPGTLLRINIPAGAVINLLNLLEITSPSGICLIVRVPALGGTSVTNALVNAIKDAGGKIEFVTN